ncbi:hypothetical protein [Baia soyae]|uniref:Uncharacterized protein n=1 Tax=Baia soyae TaxID=1544746 RepID=A0A4R2RIV8_9BACL|nr:hypothetical protein [Baia soyae]TCP63740.1 hypothetical protein EDD57_14714 [Baia soyae]
MKLAKVMLAGMITLLSFASPKMASAPPQSDYTLMVYMVGSDLESGGEAASTSNID